jgi:hypothetical protein
MVIINYIKKYFFYESLLIFLKMTVYNMNKNELLVSMILCYLFLIFIVCYNYNYNSSVSNIICDKKCKLMILFFMFLMGIFNILYEIQRNDIYSQILIFILLIGINGLICINETHTIHYIIAFLVFIVILLFMIRHCYLIKYNKILLLSLFFEFFILLSIIINIKKNIFYSEILYILNFAFFYIYLHFIKF